MPATNELELATAETNTETCVAQSLVAVTSQTKTALPTSEQIEALKPLTLAEPATIIKFTRENPFLYQRVQRQYCHIYEEHLINGAPLREGI